MDTNKIADRITLAKIKNAASFLVTELDQIPEEQVANDIDGKEIEKLYAVASKVITNISIRLEK